MTTTLAAILGAIGASVVWLAVAWRLLNQRDTARWEASILRRQPAHLKRHHDGHPDPYSMPPGRHNPGRWRDYSRHIDGDPHYDGPGAA